jgi:chaperone modulatory protein CbpM
MSQQIVLSRMSVQLLDEGSELTLEQLCRACAADAELVQEMVAEGILAPQGQAVETWTFSGTHLRHASIALRLQRDLVVNWPGVALALQLMDEVEELRAALRQHTKSL